MKKLTWHTTIFFLDVLGKKAFFLRNVTSTCCIKIEEKGEAQMRRHPGDHRHDYATRL
jgi:hypothetical protein